MEKICEEFQKIILERKTAKLARLQKNLKSLNDGSEKFIEICRSLKAEITEEIGDHLMQDVIKKCLVDFESVSVSKEIALKNLCDAADKKITHAIGNVTTNANKAFEQWDNLMANVSNFGETKLFSIECQVAQSHVCEELPADKYNAWTDPRTYCTGSIATFADAIVLGAVGGGLGMFSTLD